MIRKKIIYFIETPDTKAVGFGEKDYFDKLDIEYEYWDMRYFIDARASQPLLNRNNDATIKSFSTFEDVEKRLSQCGDNCYFITSYVLNRKNIFIYKLLKKYQKEYIVICNTSSRVHLGNSFYRMFKVKNGFLNFILNSTFQRVKKIYFQYVLDINKPLISILGTHYDEKRYNFPIPINGFTFMHNFNYEKLEKYLNNPSSESLIVFIDQYLPWHNEAQVFTRWKMDPENYYGKIALLLSKISSITGYSAVIATHPKAEKGKIEQLVDGIPVAYGETPTLLSKCNFAIMHASTVIDQCILLNKDFILFKCLEIEKSPIEDGINIYANLFRKNILNYEEIDFESFDLSFFLVSNKKHYQSYIEKNIKMPNTPNLPILHYIANWVAAI